MQSDWRPRRSNNAVAQELGDGSAIVLDPESGVAYALTTSAWHIWQACDGSTPVSALVDQLEQIYAAPRELIDRDIEALLLDLATKRLLDGAGS